MPVNRRNTQRKGSKARRNTRRMGRRVGGVGPVTQAALALASVATSVENTLSKALVLAPSKAVVGPIAPGVIVERGQEVKSAAMAPAFNASTTVAAPSYLAPQSNIVHGTYFNYGAVPPAARVDISQYKEDGSGPEWVPSTLHGQPVPNSLKNRFSQPVGSNVEHRKGNLTPTEAYARPVWQKPGEDYKVTWGVNPVAGSRFISEPEVQTWMPYVTGNPDEKVDYFEGYSAVDKAALIDTFYTKKGLDAPGQVERRFTPMYIFASIMAVDLPEYRPDQKELSDSRYEAWAERCKAGGMRAIPLKDPRSLPADEKPAVGAHFPEYVPKGMLLNQLVAHGRAPLDYITSTLKSAINSTSMRTGFVSLPAEIWWTGSTGSTGSTAASS